MENQKRLWLSRFAQPRCSNLAKTCDFCAFSSSSTRQFVRTGLWWLALLWSRGSCYAVGPRTTTLAQAITALPAPILGVFVEPLAGVIVPALNTNRLLFWYFGYLIPFVAALSRCWRAFLVWIPHNMCTKTVDCKLLGARSSTQQDGTLPSGMLYHKLTTAKNTIGLSAGLLNMYDGVHVSRARTLHARLQRTLTAF